MDKEEKGFIQGVAYMTALVAQVRFSCAPSDLFEHGYSIYDFKKANVDPYYLKIIARRYGPELRKFLKKTKK
jgi:hypothetical protein